MGKIAAGVALLLALMVGAVAGAWWWQDRNGNAPNAAGENSVCENLLIERARVRDATEARTGDLDPGYVEAAAEIPALRTGALRLLNDPAARPDGFWVATADLAQRCAKLLIASRASQEAKDLCSEVLKLPEGQDVPQELLQRLGVLEEFSGYLGSSTHGPPLFATSRLRPRCADITSA
jgi:hypothetical protein